MLEMEVFAHLVFLVNTLASEAKKELGISKRGPVSQNS